jgi:hypothetical protein
MISIALLGVIASPANADWIFKKEENAFDDTKSTFIALTATGSSYALGVRCISGELSILMITPEAIKQETASTMNLLSPKILLRVDSNPVIEADASVEEVNGKLSVLLDDNEKVRQAAGQIIVSKNRIAVALKAIDRNFHNQNFSSRNAGRNIRRVIDGCTAKTPN